MSKTTHRWHDLAQFVVICFNEDMLVMYSGKDYVDSAANAVVDFFRTQPLRQTQQVYTELCELLEVSSQIGDNQSTLAPNSDGDARRKLKDASIDNTIEQALRRMGCAWNFSPWRVWLESVRDQFEGFLNTLAVPPPTVPPPTEAPPTEFTPIEPVHVLPTPPRTTPPQRSQRFVGWFAGGLVVAAVIGWSVANRQGASANLNTNQLLLGRWTQSNADQDVWEPEFYSDCSIRQWNESGPFVGKYSFIDANTIVIDGLRCPCSILVNYDRLQLSPQDGSDSKLLFRRVSSPRNIGAPTNCVVSTANPHRGSVQIEAEERAREFAAAKEALAASQDPYGQDESGEIPLTRAARNANPEVVRLLLNSGVSAHAKNKYGQTALVVTADNDDGATQEVIGELLKHGARVDEKDNNGYTALLVATQNGRSRTVQTLLEAGANPNTLSPDGRSLLALAELLDYPDIANLIRKAGGR